MDIEALTPGMSSEWSRTVTDEAVRQFAAVTGDHNPVHLDDAAAAAGPFGGRIAHGMLTAGFISAAIANGVPGAGAIYLSQSLSFKQPVHLGDTVTVRIEVLEVKARSRRVRLATTCRNQHGTVVLDGEAMVLVPAPSSPILPTDSESSHGVPHP